MPRREPLEVELEEDELGPTNANTHHGRLRLEHGERYTFRIGEFEKEAVIFDYIYRKPYPNVACQEWIRELQRVDRLMSRSKASGTVARRPRIVGFACRRHVQRSYYMTAQERQDSRHGVLPPVGILAVCFGGTHCAAMTLPRDFSSQHGYGPHPFPAALKAFLSDHRLSFVGHNIQRDAARLNDDWGVPLANVSELTTLVSKAFREEWLRGDFRRKGIIKLEAMAYGVLDGVVVEEEPQRHRQEYYEDELDVIAYAIRDACLAYEIADKCEERVRASCRRRS